MARYGAWILLAVAALFTAAEIILAAPGEVKTLEIGETAPDFDLPGVDGRNYSLKDFASAEILVLVFTCNHCPTAQAYEDRIKELATDYRDKGVALAAISPNDPKAVRLDELGYTDLSDSFEEMKIRAKDRGFNFPYLYDGDLQKVSHAYGPTSTPNVFIFNKQRKLCYVGRVDDAEKIERVTSHDARNAIEALLAGKPVPVEKTKSFGCSIKWADKEGSVKKALERWAEEEVALELIDEAGIKALIKNDSEKLRLINIWATWCGPCVTEFPELVAINRMYRNREFELITISADSPDKKEQALSFLKKQQASSRNYLFDSEDKYRLVEAVDKDWPGSIPHTLVVAPGGKIIYRGQGPVDPLELKKAIVGYLGRYYK
ncbi:MAG TPA: redoxin domain-containing protein [archaeon]|nr:redoxin domain-containing protein [archaeon]